MLTKGNIFTLKTSVLTLTFFLVITFEAISQDRYWKVDLFSFFDNTEFGRSAFQIPQTMSGVVFAPELGLDWDSVHRIGLGVSLLHEFGSVNAIDWYYPTAYYEFNKNPYRFIMGAFPRNFAVEKYPRIFFQDSISYYRPNINGIFWELAKNQNYFNVWLDWTSRQTETARETFYLGFSGRYNHRVLFAQLFGFMYHFYSKKNQVIEEALHDNILLLTSVGIDLANNTRFKKLEADAGWVVGLERARADQTGWISQNGLLVEAKVEFKCLGLFNSFYKGEGQMHYYNDHANDLYWGDPIYRAKTYNRSDIYLNFFESKKVNIRLVYSLHFVESRIFHEQILKVAVDLNNFQKNH